MDLSKVAEILIIGYAWATTSELQFLYHGSNMAVANCNNLVRTA